jgi:uncharacterized membrane protein SpoIIM required for sporulation
MVTGAVVVSSQATSVRAANLLASFIIIPMALLIQGESVIMFWGDIHTLWWVLLGLLALAALMARVGLSHFQREELLGREIDALNIKWGWKIFWHSFTGGARSPVEWFRVEVPATVRRLSRPGLAITLITIVAVITGFFVTGQFTQNGIPAQMRGLSNPHERVKELLNQWPLFSGGPVVSIWWQNVRALIAGMFLGLFSMGILGVLPIFATMAILGGLFNILSAAGVPVWMYATGMILPHGILEIPAAILASAAVLQAGAVLATPVPGKTVGEVWITAIGEWAKIMVGVVIPLLLVAAGVEAWVTPRIASLIFR